VKIQDLLTLFRKQVQDQARPYLWDDTEILQYLVDAQDMFVRNIGGITDVSTPKIVNVTVAPGAPLASLSPYILRIRSAKLITARRPLKLMSEADVSQTSTSDYGFKFTSYLDDEDTGDVVGAVLGVEKNKIRWFKVPPSTVDSDTCRLHVYRLPYPRIESTDGCLEIDERHHMHLLTWMKHLAYSKEDAETYDKNLAESNQQEFDAYCEKASKEEERQRFKPRVVQYGGL